MNRTPGHSSPPTTDNRQPTTESVIVPSRDGLSLAGLLLTPDTPPRRAMVMNPALGVPKEFYRRFAERAVEEGSAVLLYDYRGIAGSRPPKLRGFDATMRDMGIHDIAGAIDFMTQRFPDLPLVGAGHSAGGQLIGLADNHARFTRYVMIACSTGTMTLMPFPFRWFAYVMMYAFIPIVTRVVGYAPSRAVGWGEDLPAGVAHEWADWCKDDHYLAGYFGRTITREFYDDIRMPILAFAMSDDPIANPRSVPALLSLFRNAPVETRWITPASLNTKKLGHLGYFTSRGNAAWDQAFAFLHAS